jgi:hypothetical protein
MSDTSTAARPIVVAAAESTPAPTPVPAEAPKRSAILQGLASRRQEIRDKLHLDLKVPRWSDPEIYVRYNPMDSSRTDEIIDARKKTQGRVKEWSMLANCDILASSCAGIYATLDGDEDTKYSLRSGDENGSWTKFDPDLGTALGLTRVSDAVSVVRCLYQTDGDILAAASDLLRWSGISTADSDLDFSRG